MANKLTQDAAITKSKILMRLESFSLAIRRISRGCAVKIINQFKMMIVMAQLAHDIMISAGMDTLFHISKKTTAVTPKAKYNRCCASKRFNKLTSFGLAIINLRQ